MGIPRLTHDLLQFTERAVLGRLNKVDGTEIQVDPIVIDGPSFVYFCYHRSIFSGESQGTRTSYAEINVGVMDLLDDLINHGVEIQKIYFDGALPLSKRQTRLDRLEQQRYQLETYWKLHPKGLQTSRRFQRPEVRSPLDQSQLPYSSKNLIPFAPPFMVPSVIESLRQSKYASLVEVIPDEADSGCALHAKLNSTAVISNDSDLALYEQAEEFVFVLLQSLEKVEYDDGFSSFVANCIRPYHIAKKLHIANLRIFAFERQSDPSATTVVIRQRTRDSARAMVATEVTRFRDFSESYKIGFERAAMKSAFGDLDPRLSELFNQYSGSSHCVPVEHDRHMYLPMLVEDPSRDSAWSYGQDVRQLAYSLINLCVTKTLQHKSLTEYQRRANRIGGVAIQMLSERAVTGSLKVQVDLIDNFLSASSQNHAIFSWRLLALHLVDKDKNDRGKTPISRETAMRLLDVQIQHCLAWPDIHIIANCEATLYSFRLLKQVTDEVSGALSLPQLAELGKRLKGFPPLANLMDFYPAGSTPAEAPRTKHQLAAILSTFGKDDMLEEINPTKRRKMKQILRSGTGSRQSTHNRTNLFDALPLD